MNSAKHEEDVTAAEKLFQSIAGYKDAREMAAKCVKLATEKKNEFEDTVNAVLAALQAEKEKRNPATTKKSPEEQLKDYQYRLSDLQSLLDIFTDVCEKVRSGEQKLRQMEGERKQLEARYSTLGIFAGKDKRSIKEQINSLDSNIISVKDSIRELEWKKQGYASSDAIRSDIAKAKSAVSAIQNKLAVTEKRGNSGKVLSLKEALKLAYHNSELEKVLRSRNQTIADEFILHAGSKYVMGRYAYNSISWQVLSIEDGKALLISCEGIDAKSYNKKSTKIYWVDCTLREWLNNEFFNSAFTGEEKARIVTTNPGSATEDRVFLLSISEANKYFKSNKERACKATSYAQQHGAYVDSSSKNCWWWLLTPGSSQNYAASVRYDGSVDYYGNRVDNDLGCVRPGLWINLYS